MSASAASDAETAHAETDRAVDLSEKQRRILQYLRDNADTQTYFKSRLIAQDLDLSAKEVGANMRAILREDVDLSVEKWGYSSGTTWKVTAST